MSLWEDSGYRACGEQHYTTNFAVRNMLELSGSGEVPMVLSARIRDAVKRGLSPKEAYFLKIAANKKKELKVIKK